MKRTGILVIFLVGLSMLSAPDSLGQPGMKGRGSGGWGPGTPYNRMYDPKTVETITGEVAKIDKIVPLQGMYAGIHLLVKTDKETLSVQLGPEWYLENQDLDIQPGDRVEIKGSRITFQGKPALIAAEVRKGNEILRLRDDNGFPVWAGWRRR
jgi:hypothetical protein